MLDKLVDKAAGPSLAGEPSCKVKLETLAASNGKYKYENT